MCRIRGSSATAAGAGTDRSGPRQGGLTIQCGDLPDEGDVAGVELVNNTDGNANLIVLWLDDGKTALDVPDDMGTQPVTSGSPPPWVSDMGGAARWAPERPSAGNKRSTRENT